MNLQVSLGRLHGQQLFNLVSRAVLGALLCLSSIEVFKARAAQAEAQERGQAKEQAYKLEPASATDWFSQVVQRGLQEIKNVQIVDTDVGFDLILETDGILPEPATSIVGNALTLEISDSVLMLTTNEPFQQFSPAEGIALVQASNRPGNKIEIVITGADAPPTVSISAAETGTILSVTPGIEAISTAQETLQLMVTGEQHEGYGPTDATTATRTHTPLRDIPQAIQVIPQQVLEDQGITRIEEALRNAVGVSQQVDRRSPAGSFNIRGFNSNGLRDGFEFNQSGGGLQTPIQLPNNIERIEVLRGPDSVLYGAGEPGGTVNYVTKQPLSNPVYAFDLTAGSDSFYQGAIDLTGPLLNDLETNQQLLYRFTSAYQNFDSFIDFVNGEAISIAPTLSYQLGEDTQFGLAYEYGYYDQTPYSGLPLDPVIFDLPRSRNFDFLGRSRTGENHALILSIDHAFNDAISFRSALGTSFFDAQSEDINLFDFDPETNEAFAEFQSGEDRTNTYSLQNSLTAKFNTGSVAHQLLVGLDWTNENSAGNATAFNELALDVFEPDFNQPFQTEEIFFFEQEVNTSEVGIFLQDQISLLPNVELLLGARYDFLTYSEDRFELSDGDRFDFSGDFNDQAFSPRVGLVYQPIEPVSLYASYNRSFSPNNALTREGDIIEPERGTQYEVGVRAIWRDLIANLAAYEITKTNVLRTDPDDLDFQIPIGAVRSRGLELDVGGELLPGWNMVATAFLNDSTVTVGDEDSPEGSTLANAPSNGASLWSTYEIQQGELQGLGFGAGLFYVGDRETQIPNDFVLPSYVRADAAVFYRQDNWQAQLNFKNLFDTRYYEGNIADLTAVSAPFSVQAGVSVQF